MDGIRLSVLVVCAMGAASVAWADIYRWTDKDGNVNYSDVAPPKEEKVKDVVVVTKSRPPAPGPSQQELLARIQNLEQQLQAQQNVAPPAAVAMAPAYPVYQPMPAYPQPAPVTYYDSGAYDTGYQQPYYPLTTYSVVPVYVIAGKFYPSRFAFAPRTPPRGPLPGGRGRVIVPAAARR